jgi:pimeloyl-ACP methyl ester carboxylesterase
MSDVETQSNRIFFRGHTGDRLAARLDDPTGRPVAYAVFTHCFTCSKEYHAVNRISRALAGRGIAVLRFDFTGLGESQGDFTETNYSSNIEDLLAAAEYLRLNFESPKLLIGHSLGGSAVLAAAHDIPECIAVVTLAALSDTSHLIPGLAKAAPEIESRGEAEVLLSGRTFRIKNQLLEDLREHNLIDLIGNLSRALLVLHSPSDEVVGIEHAHRIFDAAKHPKSFVAIAGASHMLSEQAAAEYIASVTTAWVLRYIQR